MANVNYNDQEILYQGRLSKKARTSVMFHKPWVDRDIYLIKNKTVMYYDGPKKRGEISLRGNAQVHDVPAQEANGMEFAFLVSNNHQNPLLLCAESEVVRRQWVSNIQRVIDDTWDDYMANLRMADEVEQLPFRSRTFHDIEAMAIAEGTVREHAMTLDTATKGTMSIVKMACLNRAMKFAEERDSAMMSF